MILAGTVPATTFIDALVNAMAEEGYEMTIIGKQTKKYQYHRNVRVVVIPSGKAAQLSFILKNALKSGLGNIKRVYRNSKKLNTFFNDLLFYLPIINAHPDRIHIQWATFLKGRDLLFELFPDKILLSLRGAHINYKPITHPEFKGVYQRLFPKIHRFHGVSDTIGVESAKYGAAMEKIQTIYSYVDDKVVSRAVQQKQGNGLNLISIGRFHWKKGYDYALDALSILKQKNIDFTYTIVAQGIIPDDIIFQMNQLGLKENVHIINGLPHDEVIKKVESSDALLLPSIEEGIANVALEAMAVGTPVISTDCGGMNEVIVNNVSGLIVGTRDSEALAGAMEQFHTLSSVERYSLAVAAKKRMEQYHTKALFVKQYKEFYRA